MINFTKISNRKRILTTPKTIVRQRQSRLPINFKIVSTPLATFNSKKRNLATANSDSFVFFDNSHPLLRTGFQLYRTDLGTTIVAAHNAKDRNKRFPKVTLNTHSSLSDIDHALSTNGYLEDNSSPKSPNKKIHQDLLQRIHCYINGQNPETPPESNHQMKILTRTKKKHIDNANNDLLTAIGLGVTHPSTSETSATNRNNPIQSSTKTISNYFNTPNNDLLTAIGLGNVSNESSDNEEGDDEVFLLKGSLIFDIDPDTNQYINPQPLQTHKLALHLPFNSKNGFREVYFTSEEGTKTGYVQLKPQEKPYKSPNRSLSLELESEFKEKLLLSDGEIRQYLNIMMSPKPQISPTQKTISLTQNMTEDQQLAFALELSKQPLHTSHSQPMSEEQQLAFALELSTQTQQPSSSQAMTKDKINHLSVLG